MEIKVQEGFPDIEITIKCPAASEEVRAIISRLRGDDYRLIGIKDGKAALIDNRDVLYFESVEKRCFIYTAADVYETGLRLYEIEERLGGAGFFRNAKSQILNIAKIKSLCPDFGGRLEVVMENGEKLIASRQYAKLLKEKLGLK